MKIDKALIDIVEAKGKCGDNFIGTIRKNQNHRIEENLHFSKEKRMTFAHKNDLSSTTLKKTKNIVIVLESPHKEEFRDQHNILPALGTTGRNLQRQFEKIFDEDLAIDLDQEYSVILVNAIQYQCSNGDGMKDHRERTNEVWTYFWKNAGEESFIQRVTSYHPEIIINGCTGKIEQEGNIKFLLQGVIDKNFKQSLRYSSPHPSSLWFKSGYVHLQ